MENCTPYETARRQCRLCRFDWESCPGPALDAEGCRYYYPKAYPSGKVIYNEKAYTSKEKGLRTMSDRLTSDLSMFNQQRELSRFSQQLLEEKNDELERLRTVLMLAHLALTEGMADVPSGERYRKCAVLRAEAKRAIRQVLPGMAAPGMEAAEDDG